MTDTSYVQVLVTVGSSDCAALTDCPYVYVVLYWQGGGQISKQQWNQYNNVYEFCIQGPITSGQICATLILGPGCSGYTLSCTPACTVWTQWPIWGSIASPVPLLLEGYCLKD